MKIIKSLDKNLEEYFLVVTISFSVLLIFFQVVMRYGFQASLSWSEEMARYLFLWQIWIGASFAAKRSRHLRAEILKTAVPEKYKNYIELVALLIWLGFSIFLFIKGVEVVAKIGSVNQLSPAMRLPMVIPYASVPVGSGLMTLRLIQVILGTVKQIRGDSVKLGGEGL